MIPMTKRLELLKKAIAEGSFPESIFKYRPDNPFTEKIITDNEIWFADPSTFNDPYDCNVPIATNIADRNEWLKCTGMPDKDIKALPSTITKEYLEKIANKIIQEGMNKIGVSCFSTMDDSILQWSHYSDFHKGICFKFDIVDEVFLMPLKVEYTKVMPRYNHCDHLNKNDEILKVIRRKFCDWSYENEIRIVKTAENIRTNSGNRTFKFLDKALIEVIFGHKMSDDNCQKYKELCKKHNKGHVQFFKIRLADSNYYKLIKESYR